MNNKDSCRKCGLNLKPLKICSDCEEELQWICQKCQNQEERLHTHCNTKKIEDPILLNNRL